MKKIKVFRKYFSRVAEVFFFLFILAVFAFSAYKIFTLAEIKIPIVQGISYDCSWCDWCDWEFDPCKPRPPCEPTPTTQPPPQPTPTPTLPPSDGGPPPPGDGGPPGPPICGATVPPAPILLAATAVGGGQVDLSWTAVDPATHYSLSYGPSSGDYLYGVSNTGKVTSFAVGGLDPGADYCFAVRAVNDCAPSELSNEICTGAVGQVLGVTTLADTGDLVDDLYWLLVIMSAVCVGLGLRSLSAKELA